MNLLQVITVVLNEADTPLHYREIAKRMIDQGLWQTQGKTPDSTVSSIITVDIQQHGNHSIFQRIDKGVYALRAWGLPEYDIQVDAEEATQQADYVGSSTKSLSFTDAAEQILKQFGGGKSMHYRDIAQKAIELGLIETAGQTPEATLSVQISKEIDRRMRRGDVPRFIRYNKGFIGLAIWQPTNLIPGLTSQIEQHNNEARKQLHDRLQSMHAKDFEELIGQLLGAIGFENVTVTNYSGDHGIDVRGTLVVGDVIRVNMAVQVKKWKKGDNVHSPDVQRVRGSLGTHDQGLIITTSDFSPGAVEEAKRLNAVPVALMNGEQLVALLVEHNIGVHRTPYELIELGETDE